jgi:hypothetical protein
MSELWYYAEGEETRGPLSAADLVALLSNLSDPRKVLIWRHGFADWKATDEVSEIAKLVVRPPPLRRIARPPTGPPAVQPATVEDGNNPPDTKPPLIGLGGWLVLLGAGLVISIPRFVLSMGTYYSNVSADLWKRFPTALWGEAILNALVFWLLIYTVVLFFRKSRRFPRFLIVLYISVIALPAVDLGWVSFTLPGAANELNGLGTEEIRSMVVSVVGALIWIPYVLLSRRVNNTFIE